MIILNNTNIFVVWSGNAGAVSDCGGKLHSCDRKLISKSQQSAIQLWTRRCLDFTFFWVQWRTWGCTKLQQSIHAMWGDLKFAEILWYLVSSGQDLRPGEGAQISRRTSHLDIKLPLCQSGLFSAHLRSQKLNPQQWKNLVVAQYLNTHANHSIH